MRLATLTPAILNSPTSRLFQLQLLESSGVDSLGEVVTIILERNSGEESYPLLADCDAEVIKYS